MDSIKSCISRKLHQQYKVRYRLRVTPQHSVLVETHAQALARIQRQIECQDAGLGGPTSRWVTPLAMEVDHLMLFQRLEQRLLKRFVVLLLMSSGSPSEVIRPAIASIPSWFLAPG